MLALKYGSKKRISLVYMVDRSRFIKNDTTNTISYHKISTYNKIIPFEDIPGPNRLKFIGNLCHYLNCKFNRYNYHDVLKAYFDKYGPIFQETLFGKTTVHVYDPDMIRTIFQDEGKYPTVAPLIESSQKFRKEEDMTFGLGNTNGETWYYLRMSAQKYMMRPSEVASYLPQLNEVTNEFVGNMTRNEYSEDFLFDAGKWYLESSGLLAFGKRFGYMDKGSTREEEARRLIKLNAQTFKLAHDLKFSFPWYKYFSTPKYRALKHSEKVYHDIAECYLEEALTNMNLELKKGNIEEVEKKYRFLFSLVSKQNISRKKAGALILSVFFDGLGATVPILAALLYSLATNVHTQERLHREVSSVLGDKMDITASDLSSMPYIKACVKETLRLYPNNLDISRITQNDLVLGGYRIPRGTHINLNNFYLHRSKEIFENADLFIPERWLREENTKKVDPFIVLPFGKGLRMCIGRRFSEQDMYVATAKIVQKCRIHWKGDIFGQQCRILMYPKGQVKFHFESRIR